MATARLTRAVRFNAAHRYFKPDWTPERNREVFGACANEHGHGHSYRCLVSVAGELGADTSMVLDLTSFDRILREVVVDPLDHQHINHAIPEFRFGGEIPTAEALAVYVWRRLEQRLPPGVLLQCVRIEEDPTLFAEYFGE